MSVIKMDPIVTFETRLVLTELESRALIGLTAYGEKQFLAMFYEKLGKHYVQPYARGIESLFETIRTDLIPQVRVIDLMQKSIKNIAEK